MPSDKYGNQLRIGYKVADLRPMSRQTGVIQAFSTLNLALVLWQYSKDEEPVACEDLILDEVVSRHR